MTVPNAKLATGTRITWTQYRTKGRNLPGHGRERTGRFLSLAPDRGAIWVCPDTPDPGEAFAIKVYRSLLMGGPEARAVAYDDDLTAASS
jgi:hypothetical protein